MTSIFKIYANIYLLIENFSHHKKDNLMFN